ncbi:hypothetical protein [Agrobacterium cavarae]|uniref:hypothetical protein n=1 Tax=Agrobacterium cavarae TaxID=2528239 RepID=UPI003FD3A680
MARLFRNLAVPVAILAIWQVLSLLGVLRAESLPSPISIGERLYLYLAPETPLDKSAGLVDWIGSSELLSDLLPAYGGWYWVSWSVQAWLYHLACSWAPIVE